MTPNQTPTATSPTPPQGPLPSDGGRIPWQLFALFTTVALLLVAGGWWWMSAEYGRNRAAKVGELAAIAGMKIEQIVAWREQHASNMRIVTASPSLAVRFALFVRSPRDPALRNEMEEWLRAFISARSYSTGLFLDPAGKLLVGEGVGADQLGFIAPGLVARASSTRSFVISDLHRGPQGKPEIDFCTPFFSADKEKRLLGFAYFRQDPALLLFPLVQSWPTPSPSAETLLVRREGEETLYLNHLRFREGTALVLRKPISGSPLLAAQALAGKTGLLEGVDYRGVPVVGIGLAVPGTGWTMIAKVDREEIFAPLRRQATLAGGLVLLLVLLSGTIAILFWIRRQAGVYRDLFEERARTARMEEGLRESEARFRTLIDSMTECVVVYRATGDGDFTVVELNPAVEKTEKVVRAEVLGRKVTEVFPGVAEFGILDSFRRVHQTGVSELFPLGFYKDSRISGWRDNFVYRLPSGEVAAVYWDRTAEKQAQESLRLSEEKFRAVVDSSPVGMYLYRLEEDDRLVLVGANPAADHINGIDHSLLIGKTLEQAFPALANTGYPALYRQVARGELGPQSFEIPYGDDRFSGFYDVHIFSTGPSSLAVDFSDISGRKRMEAELRQSEREFRTLAEAMPQMVWATRPDGWNIYFSSQWFDYTGMTPEDSTGFGWSRPFHPDDRGRAEKAWAKATETIGPYELEARLRRADGVYRWWLVRGVPLRDDGGKVIKWFGTCTDIEELKQGEAALAAEKERLAVTLRSIGDGVIACDLDQKVTVINKVAEAMTGWSAEEAVGRPLTDVFHIVSAHDRKRCENPVAKVLETGGVVGLANHTLLLARDGRELAIADSGSPIRDAQSRVVGVVLVFRDVTGQEKVETELARAQKLESLAVLAGGIAHDFNNLLSGILGNLSLARSELPAEAKPASRLVEAERATLRARDLTTQLLTFARGGAPIRRCVDLSELFDETARFAARGSSVACRFDLVSGLFADADPGQIGQVIHNLVLNAVQAMPQGGTVTLQGSRITLPADDPRGIKAGEYVRLSVRDEGAGIPADVLPRIFDPFFTTKTSGKGLGLAICHSIIKHHDGHIRVDSRPGEGTTFEVLLPACRPAGAKTNRAPALNTPAANASGAKERVLVMDDEPLVRELAVEMLSALGYDPAGAADGGVALDLYRAAREEGRPFAAVIMDLTVPGGLGGKETIARLLRLDPQARVIVSSGYSNDPIMANYRDYGFAGVLVKPYRVEELREALGRVLAK